MTYSVNRLSESHSNLVVGPDGFTESFSDKTVETLVAMGFIAPDGTEVSGRHTIKYYYATGREAKR